MKFKLSKLNNPKTYETEINLMENYNSVLKKFPPTTATNNLLF